jgi:hypothetical protein
MMVCKEFNLSGKIRIAEKVDNLYKREMIEAEDVKEFIRLLKEGIIGEEFEYYEHSVEWLKEIIDELAGEKLY